MSTAALPPEFTQRLKEVARSRANLEVSQFQIINVDEIRESLGDRWDAMKDRVLQTAAAFLRRRLAPHDLSVPCADGFIVVFGSLSGPAAEIAGLNLNRDLNEFFLGEPELSGVEMGVRHRAVPAEQFDQLAQHLQNPNFVLKDGPREDTKEHPGEDSAENPAHVAPKEGQKEAPRLRLLFRYMPVWSARKRILSAHIVAPIDRKTGLLVDGTYHGATVRGVDPYELDLACLAQLADTLSTTAQQGHNLILAGGIHASSLTDRAQRATILELLNQIEAPLRPQVIANICAIPSGMPLFQIQELVGFVRAKGVRVIATLDFHAAGRAALSAPAGAFGCGYAIPPGFTDLAQLQSRLARDIKSVHGARQVFWIMCRGERSQGERCAAAGVDFVSAPRVWPAVDQPSPPRALTLAG